MAVIVVTGDPGNGKGVFAMWLLEQAVASGRAVYSNIRLNDECPFSDRVALLDDDADEWPVYRGKPAGNGKPASKDYSAFWHYAQRDSVIVIDEADLYFDCKDQDAMGKDIRKYLKEHRKRRHDVIFIVQRVENLYVRIRRLAQRFIVCEWTWRSLRMLQMMAGLIGEQAAMRLSRFVRVEFASEEFSPMSYMTDGAISYKDAQRYFGWYDTEQILGDKTTLDLRVQNGDGLSGGIGATAGEGSERVFAGRDDPGPQAET